ncbi:MAG: ankyrin repeat domain-containing protein [Parvularculales bacterium]
MRTRVNVFLGCLFFFSVLHSPIQAQGNVLLNKTFWLTATVADVESALNGGADIDARDDENGGTPLHWAASRSTPAVVDLLLDRGADLSARSVDGWTPLHVAAQSSKTPAVVELLLDRGSDLTLLDNSGNTPFFYAQYNEALKDTEVYKRLKVANTQVQKQDTDTRTNRRVNDSQSQAQNQGRVTTPNRQRSDTQFKAASQQYLKTFDKQIIVIWSWVYEMGVWYVDGIIKLLGVSLFNLQEFDLQTIGVLLITCLLVRAMAVGFIEGVRERLRTDERKLSDL